MANSVDPDQTAPIGAVCSRSMLFAFILNLSVTLGNYLQQTTSSDAFFSWRFKGYESFLEFGKCDSPGTGLYTNKIDMI